MASAPAPRRGWAETLRVVVPALWSLLVAILRGDVARRVRANLTVSRHPKEGGGGGGQRGSNAPAIPAAGEMDEEETENQPVAAGGLHAAPADNAHDAHAYAQNGAQMLYGAAGAYAAAGYAAAGECAPADAGGAPLGAPHVGFGYGGAPAGHGLAEMQGARY